MEIISGINRDCNGLSGVKRLYLFSYVKYSRSQIGLNNNVVLAFPTTNIYEFSTVGDVDFSESTQEDDGGKYYEISLSFKTNNFDEVLKLKNKDIRAIVLDNNGNYRMLGNYNGLTCETFRKTTGVSKTDFNGFEFSFSGKEQREAFFIKDLEVITGAGSDNYLLQENGDYLLQENSYRIIL